jgi:hypothetical protein
LKKRSWKISREKIRSYEWLGRKNKNLKIRANDKPY